MTVRLTNQTTRRPNGPTDGHEALLSIQIFVHFYLSEEDIWIILRFEFFFYKMI